MLSRIGSAKLVAALSVAAVFVAGCAQADKEVSIAPLVPAAGRVDPGLGPGTRALSSGPGYKGSPSWSPQSNRRPRAHSIGREHMRIRWTWRRSRRRFRRWAQAGGV